MADSHISFDLFCLAYYAVNLFVRELEAKGITDIRAAHISVFRELEEEGSRVADMAVRANMTKQSMSALVDYLEDMGHVKRVPDPTDKRTKLVVLAEQGRTIYSFGMETGEAIEGV